MPRDFYATVAQVLPVLLLAFVWDSRFLERESGRRRTRVRFWTKPRVRAYAIAVTVLIMVTLGVCVLVLADLVPDSTGLRVAICVAVLVALATLATRIWVDVVLATRD